MIGRMVVLCAAIAISGCSGVSKMDAAQIASATDAQVCDPFAKGSIVERERETRGLGDCAPVTLQCKQMGYGPGTQQYLQCRQTITQEAMASDAARQQWAQNFQANWQKAYSPTQPTSSTTRCTPSDGGSVRCQTTSP